MMASPQQTPTAALRRPGVKRLSVALSVVIYVLCGVPVWWYTTRLQRPELPHEHMQAQPGGASMLPVALTIYALDSPGSSWGDPSGLLQALARTTAGAADAYAAGGLHLSVVVEAAGGSCSSRTQPASGTGSAWCLQLGSGWHGRPAEPAAQLDARLQAVLEAAGASQPGHYILFVLPEEAAAAAAQQQQHRPQPGSGQLTVGRFRHAWMQLPAAAPPDAAAVAAAADQLLRACFALGSGPDAAEAAARLPLSAAAHAVLSFSLLVADPESGVAAWDFGQLAGSYLQPVVRALAPVASLAIDSQVLYYTPARVNGSWSQQHDAYVLQQEQLPFFIDSDWNLLSGTAAAGSDGGEGGAAAGCGGGGERCAAGPAAALQLLQPHALHFLVYVPPAGQRPLHVAAADGSLDATNSFWIPSWGGVVIENPAAAAAGGEDGARAGSRRQPLDDAAYQRIAGVAVAQLRALLGLPLTSAQQQRLELLPAPETGFALWEVEALLRQRVAGDVAAVSKVLASLSRLVQELPNLEMPDLIGTQVHQALSALQQAQQHIAAGAYQAAGAAAQQAHAAAEAAFLHPAVLAQLNFPESHKLGIYMPLFLPVSVPLMQGLATEGVRSLRRWRSYRAGAAAV